jgi:hypothetical protein
MSKAGFEMAVSDVVDVPYRGQMLRLKVVSGKANAADLAAGKRLRVRGPAGEHVVRIVDHGITGGKVTQARLDKYGEFDALIKPDDGSSERLPIDFGYRAEPMND